MAIGSDSTHKENVADLEKRVAAIFWKMCSNLNHNRFVADSKENVAESDPNHNEFVADLRKSVAGNFRNLIPKEMLQIPRNLVRGKSTT